MGGQFFFDSIPAILFPIPFGLLADKYGRKWILVASTTCYAASYVWTLLAVGIFNLPLRWVWVSSGFFLFGGGPTVATYLTTTVVADVVPAESRSTVFFYRYCTDSLAEMTITPLAAYLMDISIWIPLIGAALSQGFSCIVCLTIPETAPWPIDLDLTKEGDPLLPAMAEDMANDDTSSNKIDTAGHGRRERLQRIAQDLCQPLKQDWTVPALVFTFWITKVGRKYPNILLQYVSERYHWSIAQASLLSSLQAIINLVLFTLILPTLGTLILSKVGKPSIRDLFLARGSIVLFLVGASILAVSATSAIMITGITLFTLGTGYPHAVRSLTTSIAEFSKGPNEPSHTARLYALISVAEGIGSLIAALGLSWAFRLGLSLGREWLGLPFGLTAVLFIFVAVIVFGIRTKNLH